MKKTFILKTVIRLFYLTLIFCSCSKSDPKSIVGKWTLTKKISWYTPISSSTQKDTTLAFSGEYIDFRTDNKEYTCNWNGATYQYDTLSYSVKGNKLTASKYSATFLSDLEDWTNNTLTIHTINYYGYGTEEYWLFFIK